MFHVYLQQVKFNINSVQWFYVSILFKDNSENKVKLMVYENS